MNNKKILMVIMSIITLVMMTSPMVGTAQACSWGRWGQPTEKIPVQFGGPFTPTPPEVSVYGNYQVGRGGILTYPGPYAIVDISIPGSPKLLVGGGHSEATSLWIANYVVNLETGKGVLCYDAVITIPSKGTFEGYVIQFGTFNIAGPYVDQQDGFRYGVLRGTGDYESWKLLVSAETTGGTTFWENYMYRPIP